MWPLDLPAREVLKPQGDRGIPVGIPWAVFDPAWYLRAYPEIGDMVGDDDPDAVLEYYLEAGQRQGHSPNCMFDERWHLQRYPLIARRVADGEWRSGFDAYCRRGALDRSPHWLFDELAYRERYPDLTNEVLAGFALCNGYDHYIRHGSTEGRVGHVLFDPAVYLANFDPVDADAIREVGVFRHYLQRIETAEPELRTSLHFDPEWYLRRYPEVAGDIAAKRWKCALHHYLCNDTLTAFDPLAEFSETWYLQRDRGLQQVVAAGGFRNGYIHFLRFGARELRSPSPAVDLGWYATQPAVRADLERGRAPDAFTHFLAIGAAAGLPSARPEDETITDAQARHLQAQAATALLPIAGRFGYRFDCADQPAVSVVLAVRDDFAATMATIAALRASTAAAIELIVVDRGSADETRALDRYVAGVKMLRFEDDIGWSRAADAGRQLASAPSVLFLSGAALIAPGSVDRAVARLDADASAGAVGGLILQPLGVVAAAGGILWSTGGTHHYRRGASALEPEVNFVRAVDFCPAACLLVRAALLSQLDGFDHDCSGGYETIDLCLRIAEAGFRVIYDPSVMVTMGGALAAASAAPAHFLSKHAAALAQRSAPGGPAQVFARHAGERPHRVLMIEDTVPLRRIGSGFGRANDVVQAMAALGHAVTVFPVNGSPHDLAHVFADMPETVEVMHTSSLDRLAAFLAARPNYYDTVWVARTHNLGRVRPILARAAADGSLNARIVLDTEAITPQREAVQAALAGVKYDLDAAMRAILADAAICQRSVAVTEAEAAALRGYGFPPVGVVGFLMPPDPTEREFEQRAGMLFVGAIHKQDSPNFDSLVWFVDSVLPLVEAELKWETRLTIAGYLAPGVDLSRFEQHPRVTLRGPVADLTPLYNAHRLFVAPTRYAAGAPYKVLEAASRGLPVVATELLRAELDWVAGQEIVVAGADDAAAFAACVVALYRDEARWQSVRDAALERLRLDHGVSRFTASVAAVLAPESLVGLSKIER